MAKDTPRLVLDGNADEVRPQGLFVRVVCYFFGALAIAGGPGLVIVLAVVGELGWPGILGGVALTATIGVSGVLEIMSVARNHRRSLRIARTGRPAIARVTASRPRSLGEEDGVELTLAIEGDDVPAFAATHRELARKAHAVGEEFPVLVDPSDGLFRVV
ncbi:hypothetical protein GOARA_045_00230 [Gordonia araii NBRC 100433]|uniref:Uncharacterized protein n=1 Tax=Gordonia araii NBRC 100433 TaxID=1073574 RepID=G7H1E4_9ACTN|nr:hypothetical protein [Gordonia araii]NNG97823.1 hypothetical protein [Gordonia araii NBRC 100433]GAB09669.1 hypothetical protein GOARA_045_00230 [Gordonia araii NBRC 100433]